MVTDCKKELADLSAQINNCHDCRLYQTATMSVPGEGLENAEIMFIGEGPGFNEDRLGRPFVGLAGQLLDKLLSLINLNRKEVYITNVVKHRPPENRDPLPDEISACAKWLDKQITIINPKIIVTLGRFSLAKFFPGVTISRIHGQLRLVGNKLILPLFHPAAALRDPAILEMTKQDFCKLPHYLKSPNPNSVTAITPSINQPPKSKISASEQLQLIN